MKIRADEAVYRKFQLESRNKAKAFIMASQVFIKEEKILKPGQMILESQLDQLVLREESPYVSRGADKLLKAVSLWNPPIKDKVCLDGGASTGGFTQVMLQAGAKKVYSVDVGYGQLHYLLREHPKVISLERENLRYLEKDKIQEEVQFFTLDLSFISITKIMDHLLTFLSKDAKGVILIKPQFESGKGEVQKGVIRDEKIHLRVLQEMADYLENLSIHLIDATYSPIKGPKGNIEYLLYLSMVKDFEPKEIDLQEVVMTSHRELT